MACADGAADMSARPDTIERRKASPRTCAARGSRSARRWATVDLPAAETPVSRYTFGAGMRDSCRDAGPGRDPGPVHRRSGGPKPASRQLAVNLMAETGQIADGVAVSCNRWWCRSSGRRGSCRLAASGPRTACTSARRRWRTRCGRRGRFAASNSVDADSTDGGSGGSSLPCRVSTTVSSTPGSVGCMRSWVVRDVELGPLLLRQVQHRELAEQVVHAASWRCGCPRRRSCRPARTACR